MPMPLTIKELSSLRPVGVSLCRAAIEADPSACDYFWESAQAIDHPLLSLEVKGWLVEAQRQNASGSAALPI